MTVDRQPAGGAKGDRHEETRRLRPSGFQPVTYVQSVYFPRMPSDEIHVNAELTIPRPELEMKASRASGAGGQHVNKTSSRVEIAWNVATSGVLDEGQRAQLTKRLASRLSEEGWLRVVASDTRSQLRNREIAEKRLADLVRRSLIIPRKRKPTRRPRAAEEARLTEKKKHSEKKRERRPRLED